MSNEEVVLKMVVNRIVQLLENESLKSTWGAELTEIVLLGQGVLTPLDVTGKYERTEDGRWKLFANENEIQMMSDVLSENISVEDCEQEQIQPLIGRLNDLLVEAYRVQTRPQRQSLLGGEFNDWLVGRSQA